MRLGIMQPYFFPYIGYFDLIANTDRWLVFDIVKYNARSWMNRNRILHPTNGWQYISVPINRDSHSEKIMNVKLADKKNAEQKIIGQLQHYRKKAPYFNEAIELVRAAFNKSTSDSLTQVNIASLAVVCNYLDIPFKPEICSELDLELYDIEHPGQWALRICERLGASEYLNPPGGREIFKQEEWDEKGITLKFSMFNEFTYPCPPYDFVENLSIIDVIMWNPAEEVKAHLFKQDKY